MPAGRRRRGVVANQRPCFVSRGGASRRRSRRRRCHRRRCVTLRA